MTLHELFEEARCFGRVTLFEQKDRTFRLKIEFDSIPGTSLEAASDFGHERIDTALEEAIDRAKQIADQFNGPKTINQRRIAAGFEPLESGPA